MILLGDGYHHEYCQEYHIVLCLIYLCNKCLILSGGVVRVFVVDQIVDISRWYGALCVVSRLQSCTVRCDIYYYKYYLPFICSVDVAQCVAHRPLEVQDLIILCKTYNVMLCILEQRREEITPARGPTGSNWSNWLKTGPGALGMTLVLLHSLDIPIMSLSCVLLRKILRFGSTTSSGIVKAASSSQFLFIGEQHGTSSA